MNLTLSTPVTLDNLNTVYQDLRKRIGSIGNIYHVLGTLYWSDILALSSAKTGDVYNVKIDADHPGPDARFYNGVNVYCKSEFNTKISSAKWAEHWEVLEGMLEEATNDTAGVIKLGTNLDSENSETLDLLASKPVIRGVKLTEGSFSNEEEYTSHTDHRAYVDIPLASANTYGLMTTTSQNIAGAKTFTNGVEVKGKLNLTGNYALTANSLEVNSIRLGDVIISTTNGVVSFTPAS